MTQSAKKQIKTIHPDDLVCMDDYCSKYNYVVDLAYARDDNLLLGERIYKPDAKLWLYKDLAQVVFTAAQNCYSSCGLHFVLYDGMRTFEAQAKMMQTKRAVENPHWMEPPRLLSPPGSGAHPRAMAIDVDLTREDGSLIDMGCAFDFMSNKPDKYNNPAHREYNHPAEIIKNREILNSFMTEAANALDIKLVLLQEEWWDFRLEGSFYNQYEPIFDKDLPPSIKIT